LNRAARFPSKEAAALQWWSGALSPFFSFFWQAMVLIGYPLERHPTGWRPASVVLVWLMSGNSTKIMEAIWFRARRVLALRPPASAFVSMVIVRKRRRDAINSESGHGVKNLVDLTAVEFASDIVSVSRWQLGHGLLS
jgi:hypothetical protein